jgi:hypothetical protein
VIRKLWSRAIVVATGPSLTPAVALDVEDLHAIGWRVIAVNDAWRLMPWADVLYACDREWWDFYWLDLEKFRGERWTSTAANLSVDDNKAEWVKTRHPVSLITADSGSGFCATPGRIHYGNNSGFQAINLAMQFGAEEIKLVGFNMQRVSGAAHFFGEHPRAIDRGADYKAFLADFAVAAQSMPPGVKVINCTPDSALQCFPMGAL